MFYNKIQPPLCFLSPRLSALSTAELGAMWPSGHEPPSKIQSGTISLHPSLQSSILRVEMLPSLELYIFSKSTTFCYSSAHPLELVDERKLENLRKAERKVRVCDRVLLTLDSLGSVFCFFQRQSLKRNAVHIDSKYLLLGNRQYT